MGGSDKMCDMVLIVICCRTGKVRLFIITAFSITTEFDVRTSDPKTRQLSQYYGNLTSCKALKEDQLSLTQLLLGRLVSVDVLFIY